MGRLRSRFGGSTAGRPAVEPQAAGRLDEPRAGAAVERGALTIRGWAIFPSGPTARVDVRLGGQSLGRAQLGVPRPDLRAVSELPQAAIAGFSLTVDTTGWSGADGEAEVAAVATSVAGETLELPPVAIRMAPVARPPIGPPRSSERGDRRHGGHRILVCAHQLCLGGASRYLLETLRELLRREAVDPLVLSPSDGPLRSELEALGIPVHVSPAAPIDDLRAHDERLEELVAWAAPQGFEVVFVNTASPLSVTGAEVASKLGIPAVWAIHESFEPAVLWSHCASGVRERYAETLGRADLTIFEAKATERLWEPWLPGRSLTLPYGLDLGAIDALRSGFDRAGMRRRLGIPADADVLICSGKIEPRKAQIPLAQAFELIADRHPRARLVLAGAGPDPDSLALAAWLESSRSGDRVQLLTTTPEIHSWYGASDILVCASYIESLPRAVLEAMAWEMPVLATSVFGLPELIEDGVTGWLCEPGDTAALAAALDRVLATDPRLRSRIGRDARGLVERRHAIEPYGRELAGLLEQAVAGTLSAASR